MCVCVCVCVCVCGNLVKMAKNWGKKVRKNWRTSQFLGSQEDPSSHPALDETLITNFSLKWQFNFLHEIYLKMYFRSKTEKGNITIELCIFKLVLVTNFYLNWQFWFFGPNCPKRIFPVKQYKTEKVKTTLTFAYSN